MNSKIIVVGLGPGDSGELTLRTWEILKSGRPIFLRTAKHPVVNDFRRSGLSFTPLDDYYEQGATFEEVYQNIINRLLTEAARGEIIYAVPGHPMVAEATVKGLFSAAPKCGATVEVIPAVSFLDAVFTALRVDPNDGLQIVDALALHTNPPQPAYPALIAQVYNRAIASQVKLALMEQYPDEFSVTVIRAAGVPEEEKTAVIPLYELDRWPYIDYLTSVYLPPKEGATACHFPLDPLVRAMERLRGENGCPWDLEQTHQSLKPYVIEEAYEVIDAIDGQDMHKLCDELGDLLLQIIFHAQIAREAGDFDVRDVVAAITEKLIRRHPHIFGEVKVRGAAEVVRNWESIKREERRKGAEPYTLLSGIPKQLPALMTAVKVQKKAAGVGFEWPTVEGALVKVDEELQEMKEAMALNKEDLAEEIGDLLFSIVNVCRFVKIDPEEALRRTIHKFVRRFNHVEEKVRQSGKDWGEFTLDELDHWWDESKVLENNKNSGA